MLAAVHETPPALAAEFRVPGGRCAFLSCVESRHAWQVCLGCGKYLQVPQVKEAQSTPALASVGKGSYVFSIR